jgi:serine/threonine protein phosphatase PrpC
MEPTISIYHQDKSVKVRHEVMGRSCNMAGSGPKRNNQDAYTFATCTFQEKKYMVVIMCDGHGQHGELFAGAASKELSRMVVERLSDVLKYPRHVITKILATCNEHLYKAYGDLRGGTTVSILIKTAGREIVANLGDCDVYSRVQPPSTEEEKEDGEILEIVKKRDGVETVISGLKEFKMTEDHGGTSDAEVWRVATECPDCTLIYSTPTMNANPVEVCEKEVANNQLVFDETGQLKRVPYYTVPGVYANTVDMDIATYFVHVPSQNKLNIGRGLGDFGYHFVSVVPSVTELTYPATCPSTTIIGTDGYFNCLTRAQIEQELEKTPQDICDRSVDFVANTFGCSNADNMTVVAISM